ncbi:Flp family type IVb pilin [Conexibacter sp. SYSU D00693]|uniref:Flp family type IVb pilin n=1 Tax=Conexibacter sp. SYSU D00693 TaxID=2812560 RepID=UPI00196A223F|nr:hypothetical protein [Conexibacter sp. SYSU D00693]
MYRTMGRLHADLHSLFTPLRARAADERGQGTIEYVGLVMLMAVILGVVVSASGKVQVDEIPQAIADKLKDAIGDVEKAK